MPPRKKSRIEVEKLICKKKLDKLDEEESQTKEDRFNPQERRSLLDAYNIHGFQIFQDTKLLHKYLPNRRECDLKGLIQRLRSSLSSQSNEEEAAPLDQWQKLCQQFMGSFAKDRKINLDDALADALVAAADETERQESDTTPNYPALLKSFSQLLMGKFPDNISPLDAQVSIELYRHINGIVDSFDLKTLAPIENGSWLESSIEQRRQRQEMALKGLEEIDGKTKKAPTLRDLERNRNIEALCLELPKIKRITDVLNPLFMRESFLSSVIK